MDELAECDFGVTGGAQDIELMAGWKQGAFQQAIFIQRRAFKAGRTATTRTGARCLATSPIYAAL
ncbi:MAG: hypothetical protein AAGH83_04400 [Pseudomonadota bacterium]